MPFKGLMQSEAIARYVNVDMVHETDVQRRLRERTAQIPEGGMQISADQGAFLSLMVHMLGARRILEIGTFTGYSALSMASAMGANGKLIALDVSTEWTGIAKDFWWEAGVSNRIDLRIAPANESLAVMIKSGEPAFDLIFIDADKESYDGYYEASLALLRPGGLIVMDNMLGNDAERTGGDPAFTPRHPLNMKIKDDPRVHAMIATIGAGMMLAWKRFD